jgi:hypothetical protein
MRTKLPMDVDVGLQVLWPLYRSRDPQRIHVTGHALLEAPTLDVLSDALAGGALCAGVEALPSTYATAAQPALRTALCDTSMPPRPRISSEPLWSLLVGLRPSYRLRREQPALLSLRLVAPPMF